jgi:hypothetical protein
MKCFLFISAFGLAILALAGCSLYSPGNPTPLPTPVFVYSPSPYPATPTTAASSTLVGAPTATIPGAVIPTSASPGAASGPYNVLWVSPGDVLNIRSGPGVVNPVSGSFPANATGVIRTGPTSNVDGDLWVEVQNPVGGNGWVNAAYLTEYVTPAFFCADGRVNTLLSNFDSAIKTSNGDTLSSLISPLHGMTVYLWRNGNGITFDRADARWVFISTFSHNWGMQPASGLDTKGSFHEVVLPNLKDVFTAGYSLTCDSLGSAPQYGLAPWPEFFTNVNYYTVFKPGTPGVDLDWRYWLVGVEYVQGQPYLFALVHFAWEP